MRWWLSRPDLGRYPVQPAGTGDVTAWFLGTSSVLLSDGHTAVLTDGFVTRPGLARVAFGRIAPDPRVVGAAFEQLGRPPIGAVVCAHSHYDHALDAPVWASLTGADLVGSESTANIGRGLGVPERRLRVVGDGDVLGCGRFELAFVESRHSPGDRYPGEVGAALVPPRRSREWRTGVVYAVFVSHPSGTVLVHASAGFRPGALHGRRADVVYLGVGTLGRQPARYVEEYWAEVVGVTGARRVVPVHWDDFFVSLDRPLRPLPRPADDLDVTMRRLSVLGARDGVEVVLPVAWQPSDPFAHPDQV
ncbi:MBL fold metallo-hydrolase [Lentzea aerocolonigenes]|uniref:MBL fold metallo-hydrolase n=1 Tax=Lentzea aerocolonigenes TaxID=68170 RepID=UPI0004C2B584|nr:MBL fold metallo-hydrolase [Lentzea aerocolonigenes]MCP2251179.1 L-ascorbate metabolism protein UlaG, beta-lactamase superfamily [Lentzea aerocolonigenes]